MSGYARSPTCEQIQRANVTGLMRGAGVDRIEEMRARTPLTPARVIRVGELPKPRSAKILRRAVRATVIGADPGDLSGAENPQALEVIRTALRTPAREA